ncbi:MAG TPA: glycosyltransferase 87 family protein [Pseudonocardiaceae bacterium]
MTGPWTTRPRAGRVLLGAQLLVLAGLLVSITNGRLRFPAYRVDLEVYRLGSAVLLHGGALYGPLPALATGERLPFTYPPFAAILLSPFALLPQWAASVAMTLLTIGLLAVVVVVALRSTGTLPGPWVGVGAVILLAEVIEPVRTAVYAGQVDVALMALVVLDVLVVGPGRWRGLLIGIAAAVKLTPAVFVLYLLLRRDYRAAVTAGVSFCCATGLGFLVARADSVRYWTTLAFDDRRIGSPWYAGNQSWWGLLSRTHLAGGERVGLWLALVAGTVVVTVLAVRRALLARRHTVALGLNAVCGLLVSPISWSHHWVWIVVVLPGWAALHGRVPRLVTLGGIALFLVAPQWWWPYGGSAERHWNWWQQLTGSSCVLFGAGLLLAALSLADRGDELVGDPVCDVGGVGRR